MAQTLTNFKVGTTLLITNPKQCWTTKCDVLKMHHRLGHIPFLKMRIMIEQGILPKAFVKCKIPSCTTCLYTKQIRRPWRQEPIKQPYLQYRELVPGEVISVDQLVSLTAGLVAQMTDISTQTFHHFYLLVTLTLRI